MKKKVLSLLLAILMLATIVPVYVFAEDDVLSYLTYEINNGEATITDCDASISGDVIIPNIIEGYPVTTIDDYAFMYCSEINNITIPATVKSIGTCVFKGSGLISLSIPDSIITIDSYAFADCIGLKNVTLGDGLTTISSYMFYRCTSLENITIPTNITEICNSAFNECENLENVVFNNGLISIGDFAFGNCSNLKDVVIPDSVTKIGNNAFENCQGITTLKIGSGIKKIGSDVFRNCQKLTHVEISQGVEELGDYAFYDCESLETLLIPDSVQAIKKYCFSGCDNLTSVCYGGNEDNWDELIIRCGNKKVLEADIYCNGEKIDSHVDNNTDGYCDNNDCNKYLWEDIYVGDTKNVRLVNGKSKFFAFTPEYTGEYRLSGELYAITDYGYGDMLPNIFESDDGCAWIYDSEMNQIAYGEGGPDMRFRMKFSLKAGETYYFECNMIGIYGGTASYRVILESLISEESTTKETITDEETTTKENITDDETTTEENIFGEETTLEENMTDETITEHTTIDNSMDDENDLTESENSLISTLLNFFKNFVESLKKMLSSIVEWLR